MDELLWRDEVSGQLAALQAGLASLQAEGQKELRASRLVWTLAILTLCCSGVLVIIGIRMGLDAPAQTAAAASLQAQIDSINKQIEHAPHAQAELTAAGKCNGLTDDAAWFSCVGTADPTIAKNFQTLLDDQAQVQGDHLYANELELGGPAVLAFGSALSGAVLGWMLPQWFERVSRRRAVNQRARLQ